MGVDPTAVDNEAAAPIADRGPAFEPSTDRLTLGLAAIILGAVAAWMFWLVNRFLGGGGWYDWIVGLFLDELILALALFSVVNLVWALFRPAWMGHLLVRVYKNLGHAIVWFWIFFGSVIAIVAVAGLLAQMGLIR